MEAEEEKAGPGLLVLCRKKQGSWRASGFETFEQGATEKASFWKINKFCEAGEGGPRAQEFSYIEKGLSPALTPFPSGPKAPLASDLEFIQDNSLLLPPVPPLLPWGSQHSGDSQALLPSAQTPREGRTSWK